ncbi:MAG: sulfite exporter TauE/SafE family protein [Gammaproteobacteria bacterium]
MKGISCGTIVFYAAVKLIVIGFLLLGCLVGLLSGLFGIGGGIILVPAFTILFSQNLMSSEFVMSLAAGTSLATVSLSSLTAGLRHHSKGAVNWSLLSSLVPGTSIGAMIGVQIASLLPALTMKILFSIVVCGIGFNLMLGQPAAHYRAQKIQAISWLLLALVVGLCGGMLGLGGGVLLVPLLCFLGIQLTQASATASMCTFPTALFGAMSAIYVGWHQPGLPDDTLGYVYWPAIWMVGLTSILFAVIGVELSHRLPVKIMRRVFGGLLVVLVVSWLVFFS